MVALLSFMTSLVVVVFAIMAVRETVRGQGAKIVAALAGEHGSTEVVPLPPRSRKSVRVTAPPYRALPAWRAAA